MYERLIENFDELTVNEKRVLQFMMDHPTQVLKMTSSMIGTKCNVSKTVIITMAQKLGFEGFSAFKFYIRSELEKENYTPQPMLGNILVESVKKTVEINQQGQLSIIADEILKSHHVYIVGRGSSKAVAQYLGHMLLSLNVISIINPDFNMLSLIPQNMTKDECIIAISLSGHTPVIVDTVKRASINNQRVIAITAFTNNPLSSYAKHNLYCIESNTDTKRNDTISRISAFAVCDLLIDAIKTNLKKRFKG